MGNITHWLEQGFQTPNQDHLSYLKSRGVDRSSSVSFYSWLPPKQPAPCPRFQANFGENGWRIKGHLITPILSPRAKLLGFEARTFKDDGSKKVMQYRTDHANWNPYFLGADLALNALWEGNDLWVVEGIFDLIALEKVVPKGDIVISTLRAGMDSKSFEMIKRYYTALSTIHIAYDNDETGKKKSSFLASQMKKEGIRVVMPSYRGKDPNEVFQKGGERALKRYFLF